MNKDDFALPPPPRCAEPQDEDFNVEPAFDIDLAWLRPAYAASIREYIEAGLLPGRFAGGRLNTMRDQLEPWLNEIGHSSNDLDDHAFIPRIR
jgi:hypothetical protein